MKDVLLLVPSFAVGGAEIHTKRVGMALAAHGVGIRTLCPEGPVADLMRTVDQPVETVRTTAERATLLRLAARLPLAPEKQVVVTIPWSDRVGPVAAIRPNVRIVGIVHCLPPTMGLAWPRHAFGGEGPRRRIERVVWRRFDVVVPVAPALERAVVEDLGVSPRRIALLKNAVWGAPSSFPIARAPGPLRLLWVGRLDRQKSLEVAIEALGQLRTEAWQFTLVGAGDDRDRLGRLANTSGISDRVIFLGHQADPWPHYAAADVLVFPSFREAMPLAPLEAMWAGLTVIAADAPSLREILPPDLTVWARQDDVSEWVSALRDVCSDPASVSRRRPAVQAFAKAHWSETDWTRRLLDIVVR